MDKLREQSRKLADEAGLLESRAAADALTPSALNAQAEEFARRALQREARTVSLRAEVDSLLLSSAPVPAPAAAPDSGTVEPDPAVAAPPEPGTSARIRELRSEMRADSLTAMTFRAQADDLAGQARSREASAADARRRAAEARRQEEQLRAYAERGRLRSPRP